MPKDVLVMNAMRSAIAPAGAALAGWSAERLGSLVRHEALARARLDAVHVDAPGSTGLEAVLGAARRIRAGELEAAVGGGVARSAPGAGPGTDLPAACVLESRRRAARAIAEGRFGAQIVPLVVASAGGERILDTDEPAQVAAAPGDAAAFLVLGSAEAARRGAKWPLARLLSCVAAAEAPGCRGQAPAAAMRAALEAAGLELAAMDVVECDELSAAQMQAVCRGLGAESGRTNPNGGALALGHPQGCSGAVAATKALHELRRIGGRYALVAACSGPGQGLAAVFESV